MARIRENLDGGLYDGPDPAQLGPGQLSYIQNAVYRPSSPALRRAPGRVTWGTASADVVGLKIDDITGLRDIQFDNSAGHYLIAQVSGSLPVYATAFVGDTGTFGQTNAEIFNSTSLEAIQFENAYYLMNGTQLTTAINRPNTNIVVYLSATAASSTLQLRQHGMIEVSASPPTTTATAASALSVSGEGYLEYWTTEVIKYQQDGVQREIESSFGGQPTTYFISASVAEGASCAPIVPMPAVVNISATHWRIYRSPFKVYATDRAFPGGFLAGEQSTASSQFVDTVSSTQGSYSFGAGFWNANGWHNQANVLADEGDYGSATGGGGLLGGLQKNTLMVTGFNFGGFQGTVAGVEVEIQGYVYAGINPFTNVNVTIGKKGTSSLLGNYIIPPMGIRTARIISTNSGSPHTVVLGGPKDRWVPLDQIGLVDSDFSGDLVIGVAGSNLALDYIKARVYYGAGMGDDSITPFPTVVYTFGFETSQVGRNGTPPSSRTGAIYEDALVVNDESNPSLIRYSYPGKPDYFPETYFIDFETRDNDKVQCIKVVNNRIVVMMDRSTYRVNYLPSERDASFDRGKAIEPISQTYGCINPMCACTFSLDDSNQILAFVSQKGIHTTDGFSFNTLTDNINWRNILSLTSTSRAIALVNDPEAKVLKFLYRNDANTENFKILELSYADRHATKEELKIAGQINMRNWNAAIGSAATPGSVWCVPRNSGDTMTVIGYGSATGAGGGMVYRENGTTIPALDPNMAFATRRMFLGGQGGEVRLNEVYGYIGSYTNSIGVAVSAKVIKTNDDSGEQTKAAKDQLYGGRFLGKWQMNQIAEGVRLSAVVSGNPNNDVAWDYLLLDGIGFGEEDSGK